MIHSIDYRFDQWVVLFLLLMGVGLFLAFRRFRNWTSILRAVIFALIFLFVLEPTIIFFSRSSKKPSLSILVDVSRSMSVHDREERLESVKKVLRESNDFLQKNFDLSYFQFSQNSFQLSLNELLKLKPDGSATNLLECVRQVIRGKEKSQTPLLLFSDGTETSLKNNGRDHASFTDEILSEAPIYTVGVGNIKQISDIVVKDLRGSDFAFKGRPVEFNIKIQNFGFEKKSISVILKEKKGNVLEQLIVQKLSFEESPSETEVSFRFIPSAVGSLEYRVEVPVQEGEMVKQNNFLDFHLEVGREKIRVLYLCGQPGPEYAFLRQILKSDPSIELVSFVILRNPENVVPVGEDQLSLIPFPAQEIFERTLTEFDLLIFENFSYNRFGIFASHLDNIQRFVEERGGGFLMIGGENSFGKGGYQGTGIERILPVLINASSETIEEGPFSLRILESQHPIFNIGESLTQTEKRWKKMVPLNGYHQLPGIKSGAVLLATNRENGMPAIVCWQKGKGRVMAISAFSTWQWALGLAEESLSQSYYTQFWRQTTRWLTTSIDSKVVRIILTESQAKVGEKMVVKLVIQPGGIKSLQNSEIQLTISNQTRFKADYPNSVGREASESLLLTAIGKSEYRSEWIPQREGEFLISAMIRSGSKKYEDHKTIQVTAADLELENPYPDHRLLKDISQKSGGEFFELKDFSPELLKEKIKAVITPTEKTQKRVWRNPWLFSLLISLLLFDWGIGRVRGEE